ncbi:Retrotransposon gag protein [Gossypium australe]|uniref:Retrotransposon gag protein n=1 Tax=Gossypium australe TaxID=47621 RepID=A0A5B6VDY9_9ROSI|nr:Retrotransposon gag protein [Gossypium australe]
MIQESITRPTISANNFGIKPEELGSIMTWDELAGKFLQKFFLISKALQLRREIVVFRQMERESFHEAWEHFKTLLILDGSTEGAPMNKTYEDAYEIIENMALNSCQWLIEHFAYGQKPDMVKVIQEDDKYQ